MIPLGALITGTLGSILAGLATPTEAASMGASGAVVLALAYRKLNWQKFRTAAIGTLQTSSMVIFLGVASNVFGAVFARLGAADFMTNSLLSLNISPFLMLLVIMVLIFLLGWPFEWPAIIYLFLPMFMPIILAMKYDLVWFGTLVAVNLQTAFLSPCRYVRLLFESGCSRMGTGNDLQRDDGLYGPSGYSHISGHVFSGNRPLVPQVAL